jgi:hypothetical protein
MKKIALVVSEFYQKNRIFDGNDIVVNRDDCQRAKISLKHELKTHKIDLSTQDINSVIESDLIVFMNMPDANDENFIQAIQNGKKRYLLISELGLIHRGNNDIRRHEDFTKIFTYQDDLVDNVKYFKCNYSFNFPLIIPKDPTLKEKLCLLIAGNKTLNHPLELYSKRIEAIRWFEKYHPENFDLYGIGWDLHTFQGSRLKRVLNRSQFLRKMFAKTFPSYRGKIERKHEVLLKYKFSICYENARDVPGWITEKIFDCFFAGCVPIYWGANNVEDHIPEGCFIDKRHFKTYGDLYKYMTTMSDVEYVNYLAAIEEFLKSDKAYTFSIQYFIQTLTREILSDLIRK